MCCNKAKARYIYYITLTSFLRLDKDTQKQYNCFHGFSLSLVQVELHTSVLFHPVCVCVTVCSHMNLSFLWVHKAKLIFMKTEMMKQSSSSVWLFAFIQVAASVSTVLLTHCSSSQPCTATHAHTQLCVLKIHVQSHTRRILIHTHTYASMTAPSPVQSETAVTSETKTEWLLVSQQRVLAELSAPDINLITGQQDFTDMTNLHTNCLRSWTEIWGETET